MLMGVGRVMLRGSKEPSMQPTRMKPFMLVTVAVITTELRPERGSEMERVGVAKNWMSSVWIWVRSGRSMESAVEVKMVVEVELRERAERMSALVVSTGMV